MMKVFGAFNGHAADAARNREFPNHVTGLLRVTVVISIIACSTAVLCLHSLHSPERVTVLLSTISGLVPSMLAMNAVNNPAFGKNISHQMLSVLIASDRSEEFFADLAKSHQSKSKRLIMSIGPLLLAALVALLLKGGAFAKGAAVAKGAAAQREPQSQRAPRQQREPQSQRAPRYQREPRQLKRRPRDQQPKIRSIAFKVWPGDPKIDWSNRGLLRGLALPLMTLRGRPFSSKTQRAIKPHFAFLKANSLGHLQEPPGLTY